MGIREERKRWMRYEKVFDRSLNVQMCRRDGCVESGGFPLVFDVEAVSMTEFQ